MSEHTDGEIKSMLKAWRPPDAPAETKSELPAPKGSALSAYLGGCERHRDRTDLSCCKIRRADGSPLTTAEAWQEIQSMREAARRAVKIAREGRYSAVNICEVVEALEELERLYSPNDELTHRRTKPPGCAEDAIGGCVQ